MAKRQQLECRVIVTYRGSVFDLGMYCPVTHRYEKLGSHKISQQDEVIGGLRDKIEREGHRATFSEVTGPR